MKHLIDEYKRVVFQLADEMAKLKKDKGRKEVIAVTGFDVAKVNQLTAIGDFTNRKFNLLPEHYLEIIGLPENEADKFLKEAVAQNLTPCQLRKLIRGKIAKIKNNKKIAVNGFGRCLQLVEKELRGMNEGQKVRAKAMLNNL